MQQILALNKIKKKKDNPVGSLNELLLYDHGLFMSLGWISLLVLWKSFLCVCIYIFFGIEIFVPIGKLE